MGTVVPRVAQATPNSCCAGATGSRGIRVQALLSLVAALATSLLLATGAQAIVAPVTPPSPVGGPGTGAAQFDNPSGLAVNQTSGDVYVADTNNNRIERFDAQGAFISAWGYGVADGSPALQTCTSGCQAGLAGNGAGQLSAPAGVAVDSGSGSVYVVDVGNTRITQYGADGSFITAFGDHGPGTLTALVPGNSIAVGPSGSVFVVDNTSPAPRIAMFDGSGSFQSDFIGANARLFSSVGSIAFDPAGNLYVVDNFAGVLEIDPTGTTVTRALNPGFFTDFGVAVNPADSHPLIVANGVGEVRLIEFDATGNEPGTPMANGTTTFGTAGAGATGLAYNGVSAFAGAPQGALFVADPGGNRLVVLTAQRGAPLVDATSASHVSSDAADLIATVNPNLHATGVSFEYGTSTAYGASTASGSAASIGADGIRHTKTSHISGLAPLTTYHYRAVATSAAGTTHGPDRTFTTMRAGGPLSLPDRRAYELVSPVDKGGTANDVYPAWSNTQSSPSGDQASFASSGAYGGAQGAGGFGIYAARRTAGGWITSSVMPLVDPGQFGYAHIHGFSADMSQAIFSASDPVAAPGATPGAANIYVRDTISGAVHVLAPSPAGSQGGFALYDSTADFSRFIFGATVKLTPDAVDGVTNVYESDHGTISLVSILPDGTAPAGGAAAGDPLETSGSSYLGQLYTQHTLSADGSRVFFTALETGEIYARIDGTRTVAVSASQRSTPDPSGPQRATWVGATANGGEVFFTSGEQLTDDATGNSVDLYRYDVDDGTLVDLTAGAGGVIGMLGIADDGNSLFVVSAAVLAPGGSSGESNVYVWQGSASGTGSWRYVTAGIDTLNWQGGIYPSGCCQKSSRVTPDGRTLLMTSKRQLTDQETDGHEALYRYSAVTDELDCVSCSPTGTPSTTDAGLNLGEGVSNAGPTGRIAFQSRNLSDDGSRVFFDTAEPLVPEDGNGQVDVYQWHDGALSLISTGSDSSPSNFGDSSPSGNDVFFTTRERLVGIDTDNNLDLYDARVDGGIAAQAPAATVAPCAGDACRAGSTPAPALLPVGSESQIGPGNATISRAVAKATKCSTSLTKAHKLEAQAKRTHAKAKVRRLRAQAKQLRTTYKKCLKAKSARR